MISEVPLEHNPYLIRPGQRVELLKRDTGDKSLFPMDKEEGKELMKAYSERIDDLQEQFYAESKNRLLVVIQALDTGGKDGTVRDVFEKMDPQGIRVSAFKKPNEQELSRDFLWRIHKRVPRDGEVVVFNRSHYEDIVAVRAREIYPKERWSKRYDHVVHFEQMLAEEGTTIVKIYLHLSKDEQKERLQSRLDRPDKHWKFNPADLEDRALWDDYMDIYSDLLTRTSTALAPWYVVPADRKWYRNLAVADIIVKTLEGLEMTYPEVDFDPSKITIGD